MDAELRMMDEQYLMDAILSDKMDANKALKFFAYIDDKIDSATKDDGERVVKHWSNIMQGRETMKLPHYHFDPNVIICGKFLQGHGLLSDNPHVKDDIKQAIARVKENEESGGGNWVKDYEQKTGVSLVNWDDGDSLTGEETGVSLVDWGEDDAVEDLQSVDPQPGEIIDVDTVKVGDIVFVRSGLTWEKADVVLTPVMGLVGVKFRDGQIRRLCEFGNNNVKSAVFSK